MADEIPKIRVFSFKTSFDMLPVKGDPLTEKCDAKGYKIDASGRRLMERQAEDWVSYAPSHSPLNTRTMERVRLMVPDPEKMGEDQDGEKLRFMTHRWNQIAPAYEAFKNNREIPINGTPLAAWAGVTPEQADVLRTSGIRTVEEVRDMTEGQADRVKLPNMRDMRKQAKLFLENSDSAMAAAREAAKDAQIAEMVERQAAMEAMIEELTKPKGKEKVA